MAATTRSCPLRAAIVNGAAVLYIAWHRTVHHEHAIAVHGVCFSAIRARMALRTPSGQRNCDFPSTWAGLTDSTWALGRDVQWVRVSSSLAEQMRGRSHLSHPCSPMLEARVAVAVWCAGLEGQTTEDVGAPATGAMGTLVVAGVVEEGGVREAVAATPVVLRVRAHPGTLPRMGDHQRPGWRPGPALAPPGAAGVACPDCAHQALAKVAGAEGACPRSRRIPARGGAVARSRAAWTGRCAGTAAGSPMAQT